MKVTYLDNFPFKNSGENLESFFLSKDWKDNLQGLLSNESSMDEEFKCNHCSSPGDADENVDLS